MVPVETDPHLWLEDITGDDALEWVNAHNEPTLADLGGERFEQMRAEALQVLDTDSRIPYVRRRGEYLYNFWRDATNPRGLWRRTTLDSYRTADPDWDVLIDVDALAADDGENWVWAGADVIEPDLTLALVGLSRGGSDATVVREFDMRTQRWPRPRRCSPGRCPTSAWAPGSIPPRASSACSSRGRSTSSTASATSCAAAS
jgi:prolyl oligopeptidase